MKFEFEKTSIPSQYSIDLKDNFGMIWVDSKTADMYRIIFSAIADTLKFNQNKDVEKTGFVLKDDKGNFKLGAIMTFRKPEDGSEEDTGNWFLELTFDEDDMDGIENIIDNHNDIFIRCATQDAYDIAYGRFKSVDMMYTMFIRAIDTLVAFLDQNASETEEVEVNLRGVFTATVGVEDGVKVFAITPGEIIKQLIKNDSVL